MSTLAEFLSWLDEPQQNRLLRLSFPNDDAPQAQLLPNRLQAREGLSRGFAYRVELLSPDAGIKLEDLHGKLLCVSLTQTSGQLRPFTGYVWDFRFVKTDGGLALYEALLVPWLEFLHLRQNNRVFHEQNLAQQTDSLLADYSPLARAAWQVTADDPVFTMAVQFGESDHNYLSRRLERAGWNYRYEHDDKGHTWIVGSDTGEADPIAGLLPTIRYHSAGGSEREDAISQWSPVRRSASAQVTVSGFDFKTPTPVHAGVPTVNRQGAIPALEVHRYEGHYGFKGYGGGDALARTRMMDIEATGMRFEGEGNCDRMVPGHWFRLTDHFDFSGADDGGSAEFLIIEVEHEASNNYLQASGEPADYRNRFVCQPRAVPWQPGLGHDSRDTRILAPQTATVVGPDAEGSVHVDTYGRTRVQFHWDRAEGASALVRVSTNWAGGEQGLVSHPRVGTEVVIQFLDGNPDHPLITGAVFNQERMPPWQLPSQKALTGLRSRELAGSSGNRPGGRSNHLVLDDTAGQMQLQAKSDHQASQLSLGNIARIEDTDGRKDLRGQGMELRTDGHGAVRAQQGLLITTEGRPNAQAHITDMGETVERLQIGQAQHAHWGEAALKAQAQEAGDQDEVAKALQAQNQQLKGEGGDPKEGKFPEFQAPHLTLASPAGIQSTTQGSTHVASMAHNALTSGGHTSIHTGKSLLATAKEAVRLFAYNAGMRLIAAAGDIDITALKNSIRLLAQLEITQTAQTIRLQATKEVEIVGGGSFSRWTASGIEHGTSGTWHQQAANHSVTGPANGPLPTLPTPISVEDLVQKQSLAVDLGSHAEAGQSMTNKPYELYKDGALVDKGLTDANGQFVIKKHEPSTTQYDVKFANGHQVEVPVKEEIATDSDGQAAQGVRDT